MRTWAIRNASERLDGYLNKATLATQAFVNGAAEALTHIVKPDSKTWV